MTFMPLMPDAAIARSTRIDAEHGTRTERAEREQRFMTRFGSGAAPACHRLVGWLAR